MKYYLHMYEEESKRTGKEESMEMRVWVQRLTYLLKSFASFSRPSGANSYKTAFVPSESKFYPLIVAPCGLGDK